MKKSAFLLTFLFIATIGFSQNNNVVSAFNYHRNGKLDKAKEAIDKATVHPKTVIKAKTWYYAGNIYIDIYRSQDEKYINLDPDALNKSYEAYKKAKELDTKNTYTLDIIQRMPIIGEAYFNDGANKYNKGMTALDAQDSTLAKTEFTNSVKSFENAYEIYSESGAIDTLTIYYISIASELAGDYDKAKKSLETLIDMNYPQASIYSTMASIYLNREKNTEKAAYYFSEGRKKYPNDLSLLLNETNLFLAEGYTEKALNNLKLAAEIDKTNPTIFFAIGAKYNEVVDDTTKTTEMRENAFVQAVDAYNKSVELNPEYFDPNYNMGALYVNKASALIEEANLLPLDAQDEYDAKKDEADKCLQTCLPYIEKAHQIQPNDVSTLISLKEIYTRLKMYDELKEVNAKLENQN